MEKFDFLIGTWQMIYNVPQSTLSPAYTGTGTGEFKRVLNNKYVLFDYHASMSGGQSCGAHGIFAWDRKMELYRYWWFEDSGEFTEADCNFINDDTLLMHWRNSLLRQTFTKINPNKVVLKMEQPDSEDHYSLVLEVTFNKI